MEASWHEVARARRVNLENEQFSKVCNLMEERRARVVEKCRRLYHGKDLKRILKAIQKHREPH